ncbi:hypothetical protein [Collimonas sp.]|jgi:hypothetical protein|uniref:hypothetical protein n=1 Tax=Collimonas sp. TaxID=1963772 RepID=UPI0037BF48D6
MILTLSSQTPSAAPSDPFNSVAALIARHRARAGRDVLFICKNTSTLRNNRQQDTDAPDNWLTKAIKTGAELREVAATEIAAELESTQTCYHDIIVDMPQLEDDTSLAVLAAAQLAVLAIQCSQPHLDWQLLPSIQAARNGNPDLPLLLLIDDMYGPTGQALISMISERIGNVRFLQLSANLRSDASIGALHHSVYAGCAAACT